MILQSSCSIRDVEQGQDTAVSCTFCLIHGCLLPQCLQSFISNLFASILVNKTCAEVVSRIPGADLTPVVKSVAKCRASQVLKSSRKDVYCRQGCHEIRTCVRLDPKDEGHRRQSCCGNYARRNITPLRKG